MIDPALVLYNRCEPWHIQGAVGPFRHECILNTFAQFLEATDHLPTNIILLENGHPPRGALALATAAVCPQSMMNYGRISDLRLFVVK